MLVGFVLVVVYMEKKLATLSMAATIGRPGGFFGSLCIFGR